MEKTTTIFLRDLPVELIREFKACCYAKGNTMKGAIVELIEQYLKKKGEET